LVRWAGKWEADQTRWQRDTYHHTLLKFYEKYLKGRGSVLVPLCGKTKDLHYLTGMGHETFGVEGIHKAIIEFASENADKVDFDAEKDTMEFKTFETFVGSDKKTHSAVKILRGDFFLLGSVAPSKFRGVWDRASLVAIEPTMRGSYAKTMGEAMAPGAVMLLSTFWREKGTPEAMRAGPPFSVSERDVRGMYEGLDWVASVELLETIDYFRDERFENEVQRWKGAGLTEFKELVFVIKKKK